MPLTCRRGLCVLAAGLVSLAGLTPATASASNGFLPPPIPKGRALTALTANPHVLLAVEPGLEAERLVAGQGGRLVSPSLHIWQVGGGAASRLVPELARRGLLRYAEPDRVRRRTTHLDQGDPLLPQAWYLSRVGADSSEPPGEGVAITIIDTGLDVEHPDFAGRPGLVLLNEQTVGDFPSGDYHGTIVAATAAAAANGLGTVGVYPTAALRIYDLPDLEDSSIIAALDKVASGGVVNLSIGGPGYSRALYEGVMRAVDRGALVVAAAGNSYIDGNPDIYPADYPHVLTVAATDEADKPLFFSSGSETVDIAAPGADIVFGSPTDPDDTILIDGTSFSAPIVSAAAAWVWTVRDDLEPTQVFELVRRSAKDIAKPGFDTRTGFGLVSIPRALSEPSPPPDPYEPNDDVDLVQAGTVLAGAKPPLTTPSKRRATIEGRLDGAEDPRDVYRVYIPVGRTIEIKVVPDDDVTVALWDPRTKTVLGPKKYRLALSARPRRQTETLRFRNPTGHAITVFVEVRIPGGGGDSAGYTLNAKTTR
jgi:hypothetical protein